MTAPAEVEARPQVPAWVLNEFYGAEDILDIDQVRGGEINTTWQVESLLNGDRTVIQRISLFGPGMIADMEAATDHLSEQGWEVPRLVRTRDGRTHVEEPTEDPNRPVLWRVTKFIESDGQPETVDETGFRQYGDILGRLHRDLAGSDYEPRFRLDHFHDTEHYVGELRHWVNHMPDEETAGFAALLLSTYDHLRPLPDSEPQLIHGDPKTDNILFRGDQPYTYIDWDTVMRDTVWVDIGDMMRSMVEDSLINTGQPLPLNHLREFAEGYRLAAMPEVPSEEFFGHAVTAMNRITLELAVRYVNDIADGKEYWVWDDVNFSSRRDSNLHRAGVQWQIYSAYNQPAQATEADRV